jgi:hypothetical protein
MEITIPWTPVKALLHLAGKADIRKWVNAVWIDQRGPHMVLWASTGVAMGVLRTEEPSTDSGDWCLPRHILEACKGFSVRATVKREPDGRMSISCMGTTHYWQDEGHAPVDWRRAVPTHKADGVARQFDATLLQPFVKVREALHGKESKSLPGGVMIAHDSDEKRTTGLLVQLTDLPDFVGLLMPLRAVGGYLRPSAPDWVHQLHTATPAEETCDDLA